MPGEEVHVPCSYICCKATYKLCWRINDDGILLFSGIKTITTDPPNGECIDNNPTIKYPLCVPGCWLNPWGFEKPVNIKTNPDYK